MTYAKRFLIIVLISLVGSNFAKADHRKFVWTYEFMTMPKGMSELESYTTFESSDADDMENTTTTKLNLEFEVGMNDDFDFAVYQKFTQSPGKSLIYDGFKLRARHKLAKEGSFFMDPLIYLEYQNKPGFKDHVFEPKLILSKEYKKFTFSINPYCEIEKEDSELEIKPKYALALGYEVSHLLNIGVESVGSEDGNYIGPTIAHGLENAWMGFGALHKIGNVTSGKPEIQVRLILGFVL